MQIQPYDQLLMSTMLYCILLLDYKFALCKYDNSKSVGLVCAIGSSFISSMWNPCLLYYYLEACMKLGHKCTSIYSTVTLIFLKGFHLHGRNPNYNYANY